MLAATTTFAAVGFSAPCHLRATPLARSVGPVCNLDDTYAMQKKLEALAELSIDAADDTLDEVFEELKEAEEENGRLHARVAALEASLTASRHEVRKLSRLRHITQLKFMRRGLNKTAKDLKGEIKGLAKGAQQHINTASDWAEENLSSAPPARMRFGGG
jgi:chromosome segregation ATPase